MARGDTPLLSSRSRLVGEFDEAVDRLEDGYEERSPNLVFLQRPEWDPLRDHPRFQDLRRRVGLPDLPSSEDPTKSVTLP